MTRLIWDDRTFEYGLDRGVLYPDGAPGVVWNGLKTVDETVSSEDSEELFFDGIKYLDFVATQNFSALVRAFSAPAEFGPCIGDISVVPGFVLTRQGRTAFGMSYRTLIGDDGYKLTLVYNANASRSRRGYQTKSTAVTPLEHEWRVNAVPPPSTTYKPTARFIVDSTKTDPERLEELETLLYGTDLVDPAMPDVADLIAIFND